MPANGRTFVRIVKFLLAGVTIFCVSWMASVSEWHTGMRWTSKRGDLVRSMSTMRTIIGYSEKKQAEMDRPTTVSCDRLPVFPKVLHFNRSWSSNNNAHEWQQVGGTRVSLYAAYYDERTPQRYVRILATFPGRNFSSQHTLFCQTRSSNPFNDSVEVVAAKPLEIWYDPWDEENLDVETPLLLSCPLTEPLYGPSVVAVVMQPCDDPINAFELIPTKEHIKKKKFIICVKDMEFSNDISQNIIEWIEINKILGVDMIDVYVNKVTKATEEVLLHYEGEGYVRLFHVPIKDNVNRSLWQRRRDHAVTYNDCLYRNLQQSDFIVPLDVDEIIVPKIVDTWPKLLPRLKRLGWDTSHYSSILIRNVFFFGFMQDLRKYKSVTANSQGLKDSTYIKRDDVRIKPSSYLAIGDINLVDDSNLYQEVVDNIFNEVDEEVKSEYEMRCGRELPTPKLVRHVVSSAKISPFGMYSKSWMATKKVLTAFNHYPLASIGTVESNLGWSAPVDEVQLNHYKESCNTTIVEECAQYGRRARIDTTALRLGRRLTKALARMCMPINKNV